MKERKPETTKEPYGGSIVQKPYYEDFKIRNPIPMPFTAAEQVQINEHNSKVEKKGKQGQ